MWLLVADVADAVPVGGGLEREVHGVVAGEGLGVLGVEGPVDHRHAVHGVVAVGDDPHLDALVLVEGSARENARPERTAVAAWRRTSA